MEKVYARQRIIYSQPSARVDELILPPHPGTWWRPKSGAITGVELVGAKPTKEFIEWAEALGWAYCQYDGRFYPL